MTFLTAKLYRDLLAAGRAQRAAEGALDLRPLLKLFASDGAATWLLSEIDPDNPDLAFSLCDLGLGEPELGWVSLSELARLRGRLGLPVERDRYFTADRTLSAYATEAKAKGCIIA